MDYEKKYKEALSRAASMIKVAANEKEAINYVSTIFPELKESEDERVKKRILLSLEKDLMATKNSGCDTQDLEQCIAWLEKQGDQKPVIDFKAKNWYVSKVDGKIHDMTYNPTDKVEPKFKVGDIVCKKKDNSFCATINSITDTVYLCDVFDSDGDYDDDYAFLISEQDEYELVEKIKPQSAWSDGDEEMTEDLIKGCISAEKAHHFVHTSKEIADWLKSIKDRIGG